MSDATPIPIAGKPPESLVLGIVGLGLMGGALALALRRAFAEDEGRGRGGRRGGPRLLACDTDGHTLTAALDQGLIDEAFADPAPMLPRCDLVFLCLNPSTLLWFLETWMGAFKTGALLTDIAGIKGSVVAAVEKNLREDLDFIPGHPMAGSEKGGFANASHCDFRGKNYILTPLKRNRPENLAALKALIRRLGFGRITETTAAEHDRKIAFTSQLCHVIAAALIDCEEDLEITRFGGGSFEDLTRIAMLNAPMWTELFIENRAELLKRIERFEGSLDALKALIAGTNNRALEEKLALVRDRRTRMSLYPGPCD
ncbi:MAG: prephenate dehydrogenase [Treponema sp.]|jgi:prephenate dehydrogenase|nr:prephenate dehydrogenase [Treponema sp.]